MFVYLIANMDFKASVQLQRSRSVSKIFEAHGTPRGRSSGEFKQRENKGI